MWSCCTSFRGLNALLSFAPRITCPVRASVGFIDTTCPPCAVYSAFNAISVKDKAIVHGLGMTHRVFPKFYKQLDNDWVRLR
ncbi:MAG: acetylxylan esterase [Kiritimatiellae bacterium]|nr:acetylxylan esterase [Kiritimatiellia bacterium]